MDDVVEVLWGACGVLGFIPRTPFSTVQDFQAHVLQTFPARGETEKDEQLRLIVLAVRQAENHSRAGVVECLKRMKELS